MNATYNLSNMRDWTHIWNIGKAAGYENGTTIVLTGNADEMVHFIAAYLSSKNI